MNNNPYQAYADGSVLNQEPLHLVVALYEGALEATQTAGRCLKTGDIQGRSKAINKAISLLTELLASLDQEKGGEVGANLKRLYGYMQCRLLEAHAKRLAQPLKEVEGLLETLLDGWRHIARQGTAATALLPLREVTSEAEQEGALYGEYFSERLEELSSTACLC